MVREHGHVVALRPQSEVIDSVLTGSLDPQQVDLASLSRDDFPRQTLANPLNTFAVWVLAMRVFRGNRVPENVSRGVRDLLDLHSMTPLADLNGEDVRDDEPEVRRRGIAASTERLARAHEDTDPVRRDRRIRAAQSSQRRRGVSRWHDYLSAIKAVRQFALNNGVRAADLPDDPTTDLFGRIQLSRSRRALTPDELDMVWSAARTHRDPDLAVLVLDLVRETAARRQAVIDLTLDDIHWEDSYVLLRTKNDTLVESVVSHDLLERIAIRAISQGWDGVVDRLTYDGADPETREARAAFRRADGKRLTDRWFDTLFDRIESVLGDTVDDRFTTHWIRHTTLKQVEQNAGPMLAAQWAGHEVAGSGPARGTATFNYVRWSLDERKAVFTALFPRTPPAAEPVDTLGLADKFRYLSETGEEP